MESNEHDIDEHASCEIQPEASSNSEAPKRFRRLQANELVSRGDFVANDHQALEPWDGPTGFRADAFVKAVYRRDERAALATSERK